MIAKLKETAIDKLPVFVYILVVLQVLMDVLSYWVAVLEVGNTLTLLLRMGVMGIVLLMGFLLAPKKRIYWIAAAVIVIIIAGHIWAVSHVGYLNLISDMTNYVRVIQMPLFTICIITFFKVNEKCYQAVQKGVLSCMLLIMAVLVLAQLTGTENHTYMDGRGYIGWFSNTNSQSAILTAIAPVAVAFAYQQWGLKSVRFWGLIVGSFVAMYFLGTRLAYLGIVALGVGLGVSMILICPAEWKKSCAFFAITAAFVVLMPWSPMAQHQDSYFSKQSERQAETDQAIAQVMQSSPAGALMAKDTKELTEEELAARRAAWIEALTPIYELRIGDLVQIFGAEKTIEMYDFTYDVSILSQTRQKKLHFAHQLMEDSPASAKVFGLELARFTVNGNNYDVENDLHGIYYLYGAVGLAAMLLFLLYFVFLIIQALIKNAKRYFTWDAAAWGIALVMMIPHIYCTAGVLRRPSASFYLSVVLAVVYYLVKIKSYPEPVVTIEEK